MDKNIYQNLKQEQIIVLHKISKTTKYDKITITKHTHQIMFINVTVMLIYKLRIYLLINNMIK